MGRLHNKVALITGAGSGIGRESALLFAAAGECVVAGDLDENTARETVHLIEKADGKATAFRADVTSAEGSKAMIAEAEEEYGERDVLFRNAAIMHSDDDESINTTEEVWNLTMDINAKGVFLGCKYGIP